MSRTSRSYPACHLGGDYATKFGRDGQFTNGVATSVRSGRFDPLNWAEAVKSTRQAKRCGTKRLRAYQKRDVRSLLDVL